MTNRHFCAAVLLYLSFSSAITSVHAEAVDSKTVDAEAVPAQTIDECLALAVQSASASTTVGELRTLCASKVEAAAKSETKIEPGRVIEEKAAVAAAQSDGAIEKRRALERYSHDNPFVLTPHRPNYLMPLVYQKDPNSEVFNDVDVDLQNVEVQFQFSVKLLLGEKIFGDNGYLTAAFTNRSFWQAYNSDMSAPFRETNYEPEIYLSFDNDWEIFGFRNVSNQLIVNHQSNGRTGELSRSWNRILANTIWEKNNFVVSLKPWYRLPEDDKDDPEDFSGDDNPDIERYLGNFEFLATWSRNQNVYSLMLRNNLRNMNDNKGAVEAAWSYPVGDKLKLYVKYFNGYGESLIDYDQSMESLGVGFLLSDWL
jgi:phospholipase A1